MSWFQNLVNRNIPSKVRNSGVVTVLTKTAKASEIALAGAAAGIATGNPLGIVLGAGQGIYRGVTTELNNGNVTRQVYQSGITGALITAVTQPAATAGKAAAAQRSFQVADAKAGGLLSLSDVGNPAYAPSFIENLSAQSGALAAEGLSVGSAVKGGLKTASEFLGGVLGVKSLIPAKPSAPGTPSDASSPSLLNDIASFFNAGLGRVLPITHQTNPAAPGATISPSLDFSGLLSGLGIGGQNATPGGITTLPPTQGGDNSAAQSNPILAGFSSPLVIFLFIGVAVFFLFGKKGARLVK